MNSIRDTIRYNATIRSYNFVTTKLSGLAHLRTGMIIVDSNNSDQNENPKQAFSSFPTFIIENQIVTNSIFTDDISQSMFLNMSKNYPIVIGCTDYQWSYLIYMMVVIHTGSSSSYESAATGLKTILDIDDSLPKITSETLDRLSRILTNYSMFQKFSEETHTKESLGDDMYTIVTNELEQNKLMLSLVFGTDNHKDNHKNSNIKMEDDVRPPIPSYNERLIDSGFNELGPVDPGIQMPDTSMKKVGAFPDKEDLLGITSYSPYKPEPEPQNNVDSLISAFQLESKFNELKEMMNGKRFNEDYVRNMLHSGVTVDEVYCILTLSV